MPRLLTDRQADVLRLLCAGVSPAQAGQELGITRKGVDSHLHAIRKRLGVSPLPELCRRGAREVAAASERVVRRSARSDAQ